MTCCSVIFNNVRVVLHVCMMVSQNLWPIFLGHLLEVLHSGNVAVRAAGLEALDRCLTGVWAEGASGWAVLATVRLYLMHACMRTVLNVIACLAKASSPTVQHHLLYSDTLCRAVSCVVLTGLLQLISSHVLAKGSEGVCLPRRFPIHTTLGGILG